MMSNTKIICYIKKVSLILFENYFFCIHSQKLENIRQFSNRIIAIPQKLTIFVSLSEKQFCRTNSFYNIFFIMMTYVSINQRIQSIGNQRQNITISRQLKTTVISIQYIIHFRYKIHLSSLFIIIARKITT